MIELLEDGNDVKKLVDDFFDRTGNDNYMSYHVFSFEMRFNKQRDIGKVVVLKEDEKEILIAEGIKEPVDVRIFFDSNAIDELRSMSINEGDPNLPKLAVDRILEGIWYDQEKDKVMYDKPTVQEYTGILTSYDPVVVTEVYRAAIDQIEQKRKEQKNGG